MTIRCFGRFAVFLLACLAVANAQQEEETPITRGECTESGGRVVGDIGNGAIFRPGYVCENSGVPPTHTVVAGPGEPIASDGEVCCGGGDGDDVGDAAAEAEEETPTTTITRGECTESGGRVVGDIGNGAIFRPGYVCENSGVPPTHTVVAGPGEPIASDGEVCCGGGDDGVGDAAAEDGTSDGETLSSSSSKQHHNKLAAVVATTAAAVLFR